MKARDRLRLALLFGLSLGSPSAFANQRPSPAPPSAKAPDSRFVVYYGTTEAPGLYDNDVVVLDSHIDEAILRKFATRTLTLGYLSLGEAHLGRAYTTQLDRQGLLLAANANWPDARFVDVRDPRWTRLVIEELIPEILSRGFRGLFFDTLDSSAHLEQSDPKAHGGMINAAVDLVLAIRKAFPKVPIMVNRGYAVLPRVAAAVDMVLGESVHSTYHAASKTYVRVSASDVQWQLDRLREARQIRPSLRLFSLDYWSPQDSAGLAEIYAQAKANGLVPYVSTIDLTQVVARP